MALFEVVLHGRGLWISLDDELQRVGFHVRRVVEAGDAEEAERTALALVADDPKARPEPGYPAPTLTVDSVGLATTALQPQPGFAFYPDPE